MMFKLRYSENNPAEMPGNSTFQPKFNEGKLEWEQNFTNYSKQGPSKA